MQCKDSGIDNNYISKQNFGVRLFFWKAIYYSTATYNNYLNSKLFDNFELKNMAQKKKAKQGSEFPEHLRFHFQK